MTAGTVYLLHFDQPYKHARHYVGWASNVKRRLAEHEAGRGARLLAVVTRRRDRLAARPDVARQPGPGTADQAAGRPRPALPAVRRAAPDPAPQPGWVAVARPGPPMRRSSRPG